MKNAKTTVFDRLNFDLEKLDLASEWIVGIDEVGWGCIAGDLYLGAVAIHKNLLSDVTELLNQHPLLNIVRDSKKLSEEKRNLIFEYAKTLNHPYIKIFYGKGELSTINNKGLAIAFDDALYSIFNQIEQSQIKLSTVLFLMDGSRVPKPLLKYHTQLVIKGDDTSFAIGFASIMAKETRDHYMKKLDNEYPHFNWKTNKGYGTAEHTKALKEFGLSKFHRIKASEKIIS